MTSCTPQNVEDVLVGDDAVKVGGIDVDGIVRGKMMAKSKFLSLAKENFQFGFCSVIFGWDMHDQTYIRELKISNKDNGYRDVIAQVDLRSFRRIPWEGNIPFFLVKFIDPDSGDALSACPRSLLGGMVKRLASSGVAAFAGGLYSPHISRSIRFSYLD